ncbi:formate--tetrahydrofolate ligase [Natronosalvus caseinilyticus]|uniref:formate--tetrahydrofolate ligase n=1 Tax=Natronosalvus caseinilyticus TaxID=2953747 RepID=UPI0028B119F3|nr:formate--tetrahydrofolate ligase [Natronosalvus caseinilyticus]
MTSTDPRFDAISGDAESSNAATYRLIEDSPRTSASSRRISSTTAGPGFVVELTGDVMTKTGLPAEPAAKALDFGPDGTITGL